MTADRVAPRRITPFNPTLVVQDGWLKFPFNKRRLDSVIRAALKEDGAHNDVTTIATVRSNRRARGSIVARREGVVAGVPLAIAAFQMMDHNVVIRVDVEDGQRVEAGTPLMFISGHARGMLSAERVALNYMQRLSGIATMTARYVDAVRGTRAHIFDTRKTTPGLRLLEKYAVRAGGGMNHRLGLDDAVLIKDNHLASIGGDIKLAIRRVRELAPAGARVEVECDTVQQVRAAIEAGTDIVLLDNMTIDELRECVKLAGGKVLTEASGGITLDTVRSVAETGVDWISVGALTHSSPALDLALDFESV
jgi:nicotinate-nucleotide pyrophosphorylase (carboxylating)